MFQALSSILHALHMIVHSLGMDPQEKETALGHLAAVADAIGNTADTAMGVAQVLTMDDVKSAASEVVAAALPAAIDTLIIPKVVDAIKGALAPAPAA